MRMENPNESEFDLSLAIIEINQEEPLEVITPVGPAAFVVHKGLGRKDHADLVFIELAPGVIALAVVDGFRPQGTEAAKLFAETLQFALRQEPPPKSFQDYQRLMRSVHDAVYKKLLQNNINGGVCYVTLFPSIEHSFQAGDPGCGVFTEDGNIRHKPLAEHMFTMPNAVTNSISQEKAGDPTPENLHESQIGDFIVLASDALWKNLTLEEIGRVIKTSKNPVEIARQLNQKLLDKMKNEIGRKQDPSRRKDPQLAELDNISIIVLRVDQKIPG